MAGRWTDCTAEAVLGTIAADRHGVDERAMADAVGFMLRGQNRDGGFGSYEARRSMFGLEWAESGRDVRRLDDRALLRRVHRLLPVGHRRLPATLSARGRSGRGAGHGTRRCVAAPHAGKRRVVAWRVGRAVHLRHVLRHQGPTRRGCPAGRSGGAPGLPVATRPSAERRRMGGASQWLRGRPLRAARGKPSHPDRLGPDGPA